MLEKAMSLPPIEMAHVAPAWLELNLGAVRHQERFDYYREVLCETFLSCTPEMPAEGDFTARLRSIQLESGSLAMLDTTPHTVARTKRDLARTLENNRLALAIQFGGVGRLDIAGREHTVRRGDVYLVDPNTAYTVFMAEGESCGMFSIMLDRSILTRGSKATFDGFASLSGRPFCDAIVSCLTLLAQRATIASRGELNHLIAASTSLLAANMLLGEEQMIFNRDAPPTTKLAMSTAIKLFVEKHIANPALSPALVAERFGISARYLHKIFESNGETFGTLVLKLRLEQIRKDLSLPSNAQVSVGDIAHRWGFRDLTSFHRNFKLRFQTTPGILRSTLNRANRRTPQHLEKESGLSSIG